MSNRDIFQEFFNIVLSLSGHNMYNCFSADKIQVSKTTWMMLSMQGGFVMEERGQIEVKVKIKVLFI